MEWFLTKDKVPDDDKLKLIETFDKVITVASWENRGLFKMN